MQERRTLKVGMHAIPNADPREVQRFVRQEDLPSCDNPPDATQLTSVDVVQSASESARRRTRVKPTGVTPIGLIPVTVRLRPEVAGALKRASLERQLSGESIFTQQQLVEEALEPWLRRNGYLA